jgi:hypothetical protein
MNRVAKLLKERLAPDFDGLYKADGTARVARVDGPTLSWLDFEVPLDLHAMEDDDVVEIDPAVSAVLPDGGAVCCGEGALGADGFFARLDANKQLVWVVVLHNSNPFHHIRVDGTLVAFTNNLGNSLTVNLADPEFL